MQATAEAEIGVRDPLLERQRLRSGTYPLGRMDTSPSSTDSLTTRCGQGRHVGGRAECMVAEDTHVYHDQLDPFAA